MLSGHGIVPLADYVKIFHERTHEFKPVDEQINDFLKEHSAFYVNLISPISPTAAIVVFEGPADEVKKLRKE